MKSRSEFQSDKDYNDYLRTLIAAMAMQGILASDPEFSCQPSELAKRSIECADALLTNL